MNWQAVPPSTGFSLMPGMPSLSISKGNEYCLRKSPDDMSSRIFRRSTSKGVNGITMMLQQAFQHLTLRGQRICSVAFSASMMGLTGLPAKGEASIKSLNSFSFISHYLPGPSPTSVTHTRKRKGTRFRLDAKPCWSCSLVPLKNRVRGNDKASPKKPGAARAPGVHCLPDELVSSGLEQLGLVDQIHVGALEAVPLFGVLVVDRVHEAVPVFLIDKVLVHAVVEAGVTAFFAELDVLHVGFRRQDTVVVFPRAQQFVQILRTHLLGVFLQHVQLVFRHAQHVGNECV